MKDLEYKKISVAKLVKAEWNYKEEDEITKQKLKEAVTRNGQLVNIIVRELPDGKFEVVNGNHRYDVFLELGVKEVVAVNLGKVSKEDAIRIGIETNELEFKVNDAKLAAALAQLSGTMSMEEMLKTLPYDEATINQYIEFTKHNFEDYENQAGVGTSSGTQTADGKIVLTFNLDPEVIKEWVAWTEFAKTLNALDEVAAFKEMLRAATKFHDAIPCEVSGEMQRELEEGI